MKRFGIKIMVAVTIGAFTTFTTLLYITSESAVCGTASSNRLCLYVYKEEEGSKWSRNLSYRLDGYEQDLAMKPRWYPTKTSAIVAGTQSSSPSGDALRTRRDSYSAARVAFGVLTPSRVTTKATQARNRSSEYLLVTSNLVNLFGGDDPRWRDKARFRYYAERQRNLREGCRKYYNGSETPKLDHVLVDENRKILFCYVPKVACTNWKRVFMLLTGKARNISEAMRIPAYEVHTRNLFTSLQNYSQPEVNQILREYTKIIFVRNPFERLLSAYRNKLEQHYESSKYFQARFGKHIVKKFRKNPTNASLARGDDVTFAEFVAYLLSSDSRTYNEHWQTVTNLCHPCFVEYDLVGKYETLVADSDFVLNYLNLNFSFPALEKPSRTASNLKKYFDTVGADAIYKLYRIYEMDFKLFGYDLFSTLNWSKA